MSLTRLDNLYSSKTGKYLYVSPDDFNASDTLDNRGNSPLRPFKTIQRAFIEVSRFSYLPGRNNDRFDQFSIMLMPGDHYIDNRPGLVNFTFSGTDLNRNRFQDAADLIEQNKNFIAYEAYARMLTDNPGFVPQGSSGNTLTAQDCIDDVLDVLDAISYNVRYGGNDRTFDAALLYQENESLLENDVPQSLQVFEEARVLTNLVITNTEIDNTLIEQGTSLATLGIVQPYTQFVDETISIGPSTYGGAGGDIEYGEANTCLDVQSAVNVLYGVVADGININLDLANRTEPEVTEELPLFDFNQQTGEWQDNSILDLSNPDNVLYKYNASTGGAIVPRGCSLIGYDLRRTIVRPLYVPDPADSNQERTSIFNLTGGCYLWQFTIKDGDTSENSPLFDEAANVGKVYYQKGNTQSLAIPEYSHHKICIMTYADNADLDLYYDKVGKSFSKFQTTIDDEGEFDALVQENRIVGPLSDTRTIESLRPIDGPNGIELTVTTKINHGYFEGQFVAILNTELEEELNGTFKITSIDNTNPRVFTYLIPGKVSAAFGLVSNQVYTTANGLGQNAITQAEIDSVESASPYVFNCSIRSTWGQCGMWADGSKATGFKSMVVAQYTGVSLQKDDRAFIRYDRFTNSWNEASLVDAFATVPYHTKGDAYWKDDWRNFHIRASDDSFIQCVSVFAVGFFDHFLMESGGDMSITNSNSNFGNTSLHAIGFKGFAFNQDKGGFITDIIPPQIVPGEYSDDPNVDSPNTKKISYYTIDVRATNDGGNDQKLYLSGDDLENPNQRPAATLEGFRIGARSDERLFVKLDPETPGGPERFYNTIEPSGFTLDTVSLSVLNPPEIQLDASFNKRYDASIRIEANRTLIQDDAYAYITTLNPSLLSNTNINISTCRRDIGYYVDAVVKDLRVGGNIQTIQAAEAYFVGGQLTYIENELTETLDTLSYVRDHVIAAMRNYNYLIINANIVNGSSIIDVGDTTGLIPGMTVREYSPSDFSDENTKLNDDVIPGTDNITTNIPEGVIIKRILPNGTQIEIGLVDGILDSSTSVPATGNSTTAYLYFDYESSPFSNEPIDVNYDITQDTSYPECADTASLINSYFVNIETILTNGLVNNVNRIEPDLDVSSLASRATLFTITGGNPHQYETGTVVRLVPKAIPGQNPDKRVIRLPLGFEPNKKYYVIAPGRATFPEDYSSNPLFDGSDQTTFMLASSKENAAAGIYVYSPETDQIDDQIEIQVQKFVLDTKYELHRYKCNASGVFVTTDVPHIFDIPAAGITPQKVFFRVADDIQGSTLPSITGIGQIQTNVYYYVRYINSKQFSVYTSYSDAISDIQALNFIENSGVNFYIYADKRNSPLKFDAEYTTAENTSGLWYLNTIDDKDSNPLNIISRLQSSVGDYSDESGKVRTPDTWFERLNDDRDPNERIYRLRYVIPQYLSTVRNPLNGFVLKVRTDDKRRLIPQKITLTPVGSSPNAAIFTNPSQQNEILGLPAEEYSGSVVPSYDPYLNPAIVESSQTASKISFSIQSAARNDDGNLELIVFDHGLTNSNLKNETFVIVKTTQPQGGTYVFNDATISAPSFIEWTGNSSGTGYVQQSFSIDGDFYIVLKAVTGQIVYNPLIPTTFTQGSTFSTLAAAPDSVGDPEGRSKSNREDYLYRIEGANVYTCVPGDTIFDEGDNEYIISSVEDVGEIEDTFYIFDIDEIQERIPEQQDGIYYLTCLKGNVSPFPVGAGVGTNFRNFKFSQPISQLYPLNYKNDPVWFKQLDNNLVDPPSTVCAADNYVHGLVQPNDAKNSQTKEAIQELLENPALTNENYTNTTFDEEGDILDYRIRAQEGNATSGSEDRKIPIRGDSVFPTERKLYVELRRPSIARSGNHTFEYLGFGPGNYSTGFPLRQEVVLTDLQDFYAQSKREDGGIVFYTGLNSNGDLYIGNRKVNAITGEETFLERATLLDSEDENDDLGGALVTTFDNPVTFNEQITANGLTNFNAPVTINVDPELGDSFRVLSKVGASDDITLDRANFNPFTDGDIVLTKNQIQSAVWKITPRNFLGSNGQPYTFRTHFTGGFPSNVTPNQNPELNSSDPTSDRFYNTQLTSYTSTTGPRSGDVLLKGSEVGATGSLGWVYGNKFFDQTDFVDSIVSDNTNLVTVNWDGVTNNGLGINANSQIRIFGLPSGLNGTWDIVGTFDPNAESVVIAVGANIASTTISVPPGKVESSISNFKEIGVIGAETLRANADLIGDFKLGINTVARSLHSAALTAYVSDETEPRANLDVVGTAFISGRTIESYKTEGGPTKTETDQDNAVLIGGESDNPDNLATVRVSTSNNGRVGVNTTLANLDRTLVVYGDARITDDFLIEQDLTVEGGDLNTTSEAFNIFNTNANVLNMFGEGQFFNIGNETTTGQSISLGASAESQFVRIGGSAEESIFSIHPVSTNAKVDIASVQDNAENICEVTIGGAWQNANSFVELGARQTLVAGELEIGTRYAPGSTGAPARIFTQSGRIRLFDGDLTREIEFASNASDLTIGALGGITTIRNNLNVLAKIDGESDIRLNGGLKAGIIKVTRGRFSTTPTPQTIGSLNNVNIDFYKTFLTSRKIDTAGASPWGDNSFLSAGGQISNLTNIDTGGPDPSRTQGTYPLLTPTGGTGSNALFTVIIDATGAVNSINTDSPGTGYTDGDILTFEAAQIGGTGSGFTVQVNGVVSGGNNYLLPITTPDPSDFSIGDLLLLDRADPDTPGSIPSDEQFSEIVRIVGLTNVSNSLVPYQLLVSRAQDGTTEQVDHPDGTVIKRLDKQAAASFITGFDLDENGELDLGVNDIAGFTGQLNLGVSEFGGQPNTSDYLRLGGVEFVSVDELITTDIKKLIVNDGGIPEVEVFTVESTTGNTELVGDLSVGLGLNKLTVDGPTGNTNIAGTLTTENTLTINGSVVADTEFFTITNGGASGIPLRTTFEIDTATGDITNNGGSMNFFSADGTVPRLEFDNSSGDFTVYGSFSALGSGISGYGGTIQIDTGGLDISFKPGASLIDRRLSIKDTSDVEIFSVEDDGSMTVAKINNYITRTGGRKWLFADQPGIDGEANVNYFLSVQQNTVFKLPDNALIGDMIRIVDVGGQMSNVLTLIVRAPDGEQVQGVSSNTGSTLLLGNSTSLAGYNGGELVVQTPNASFGLIYAGTVNPDGSSAVPAGVSGWYLMDI